jgi:Zn-dependent oligopeptidase
VEATRKKLLIVLHSKCPANQPLLAELIRTRHDAAVALGYPSHAAFILEAKMAGTTTKVHTFIDEITTKLRPAAEIEKAALTELKAELLQTGASDDSSVPPTAAGAGGVLEGLLVGREWK